MIFLRKDLKEQAFSPWKIMRIFCLNEVSKNPFWISKLCIHLIYAQIFWIFYPIFQKFIFQKLVFETFASPFLQILQNLSWFPSQNWKAQLIFVFRATNLTKKLQPCMLLKLKCGFLKKSFIINAPLCSWTSLHHFLALLNSKRCIHDKWLIKKSTL